MSVMTEVSPLMSTPSVQQLYINLNVGGTSFTTSLDTLTRYPGSKLHSMFGTENLSAVPRDESGCYIIDRDGTVFGIILNFLRSGNLNLPTDFTAFEQLKDEADYFQLSDMKERLTFRMETEEKQRLTLLPHWNDEYDIFKIDDQYFYVFHLDNEIWRKTLEELKRKATICKEYLENREREVYILQCSATTFQCVIDFCNGKKSFIPSDKEELKELIRFAKLYNLQKLINCMDKKVHMMKKSH